MPARTRIITATPADNPTIQRLAHAIWPPTFGDILTPAQIEYMLEMMYSVESITEQVSRGIQFRLLLELDRFHPNVGYTGGARTRYRPVGYVAYEHDYLPATTKIHKLYVLPETQGNGYGRALIDHVAGTLPGREQTRLQLDVNYQNRAVSFYEHLGFRKLSRQDTDIGNGYLMEDWVMAKDL